MQSSLVFAQIAGRELLQKLRAIAFCELIFVSVKYCSCAINPAFVWEASRHARIIGERIGEFSSI